MRIIIYIGCLVWEYLSQEILVANEADQVANGDGKHGDNFPQLHAQPFHEEEPYDAKMEGGVRRVIYRAVARHEAYPRGGVQKGFSDA